METLSKLIEIDFRNGFFTVNGTSYESQTKIILNKNVIMTYINKILEDIKISRINSYGEILSFEYGKYFIKSKVKSESGSLVSNISISKNQVIIWKGEKFTVFLNDGMKYKKISTIRINEEKLSKPSTSITTPIPRHLIDKYGDSLVNYQKRGGRVKAPKKLTKKVSIKKKTDTISFNTSKQIIYINMKCLPNQIIVDSNDMIAFGRQGRVFSGKIGNNKVVVKLVPLDIFIHDFIYPEDCDIRLPSTWGTCDKYAEKLFRDEVMWFQYTSRLGISPKYYGHSICQITDFDVNTPKEFRAKKIGVLVSHKIDATVRYFFKKYWRPGNAKKTKIIELIKDLVQRHINAGLYDGDMHSANIGIELKNGIPHKAYNIDTGSMKKIENIEMLNKLWNEYLQRKMYN